MENNPKVSIIIPVYNGSNYLGEAIDSAIGQTYKNMEVIVVNDGSTDGGKTEEIAKSYGDRIRYFSKENGGVSTALNLGIEKMEGEWFSWLSHDDVYQANKIETQINYWSQNKDIRIIAAAFQQIDENGKFLGVFENNGYSLLRNGREFFESGLLNGCTLLIHKECFERTGLFNEVNKTVQDTEKWLEILSIFPIHIIGDVVMRQRIHSEMGQLSLFSQHSADKEKFFRTLLDKFDISWFYPVDGKQNNLRNMKVETYHWLAKTALSSKSAGAAFVFHEHSYAEFPTMFNRSFYVHLMGKNVYMVIIRIFYEISFSIRRTINCLLGAIKKHTPWLFDIGKRIKRSLKKGEKSLEKE
jgi:glycosyltransferase involved in cell wall biosynthesis